MKASEKNGENSTVWFRGSKEKVNVEAFIFKIESWNFDTWFWQYSVRLCQNFKKIEQPKPILWSLQRESTGGGWLAKTSQKRKLVPIVILNIESWACGMLCKQGSLSYNILCICVLSDAVGSEFAIVLIGLDITVYIHG